MAEIINDVIDLIRSAVDCHVAKESTKKPARFPCVTVAEYDSSAVLMDSGRSEDYTSVRYRVRVFSDTGDDTARVIYHAINQKLTAFNFERLSKQETPELYRASVFRLTASYAVIVGKDGRTYRDIQR